MNNFFTQFKDIARSVRLSQSEKQSLRLNLYTYLEQNKMDAFDATAAIASRPVPSMYFFFSAKFLVPAALLLVVGLGSGTTFAAQDALPGDALYSFKININEQVQTALATTPAAKAEVNAQLATDRLEEAEALASTGKLDATTTAQLASNFTEHVKAAQHNTDDVQSKDPGAAAQLGAQFSGALAAHGAILAQLGDDSSDTETMQNSNSFAVEVQQESRHGNHADSGAVSVATFAMATDTATEPTALTPTPMAAPAVSNGARVRTFAAASMQVPAASSYSASSSGTSTLPAAKSFSKSKGKMIPQAQTVSPEDAKVAASLESQASSSLATLLSDFASQQVTTDAGILAQINSQIQTTQTLFASAEASLAAGDTSSARDSFSAVVNMSIRLDAYLKAGKRFNLKLLSGLLTNSGGNDNGNQPDSGSDDNSGSHGGHNGEERATTKPQT